MTTAAESWIAYKAAKAEAERRKAELAWLDEERQLREYEKRMEGE